MFNLFLIVSFSLGALAVERADVNFTLGENHNYNRFIEKFPLHNKSQAHVNQTQGNFINHYRAAKAQNEAYSSGKSSWKADLYYPFGYLSHSEFQSFLGARRPNSTVKRLTGKRMPESRITIPTSFDLRNVSKLCAVKDQGQCGSCWAFATSACLESGNYFKTKNLVCLSEQQQIDCNVNCYGCNGGWFTDSFSYTENGLESEANYPYLAANGTCNANSADFVVENINYVNPTTTTDIQTRIMTYGACGVCTDATNWNYYSNGIFDGPADPSQCNHAVVIIGWGPGYWLIRNSWSSQWGENGYIQVSTSSSGGMDMTTVYCPDM
jgi:C1A family cysteine protease